MKKTLSIIVFLILVSPFFAAVGKLKITGIPGNVSSVSIDGNTKAISKINLQGGFLAYTVLQGDRKIIIKVPGKEDFVTTVKVGKSTTIKASFSDKVATLDSTSSTETTKTSTSSGTTTDTKNGGSSTIGTKTGTTNGGTTKPSIPKIGIITGGTTTPSMPKIGTTNGGTTTTGTKTGTTNGGTTTTGTKTDGTKTVGSTTDENVDSDSKKDTTATQTSEVSANVKCVPYPFKVGARFDYGNGIGDFVGYYLVTKSEKKADDNYYFEMTWYYQNYYTKNESILKGYIKGTWDHGYVELRKREKDKPEWYVESSACFNMTSYYFNAFFYYAELHETDTLIFRIAQLPKSDDCKLYIDNYFYKTYKQSEFDIDMPKGIHDIKICVPGYENFNATVDITHEVKPGDLTYDPNSSFHVLKYNPKKGEQGFYVEIRNVPNNSSVYVDGKKDNGAKLTKVLECSMQINYNLRTSDFPSGKHTYTIVCPGYEDSSFDYEGSGPGGISNGTIVVKPKSVKTVPYFVQPLSISQFALYINGKEIKDYKKALLNANKDNVIELYKDGKRVWIKNNSGDVYYSELTSDDIWGGYRTWVVRGVPTDVDVYFGENDGRKKTARIGTNCYFITDTYNLSKLHIEAEKKGKVFYSVNIYSADDYNVELVIDKSLVKDKYIPGDLYYGKDGKPCGVVFYTSDEGKHGKIISFAETKHPFVVDDREHYGTVHAALDYANGGSDGLQAYKDFSTYIGRFCIGGDRRGENLTSSKYKSLTKDQALEKYFPAFYYAHKYNGGGYDDWFLPSKTDAGNIIFLQEIINKALKSSGNLVLDLENKSYSLSECQVFLGQDSYMTTPTYNRYILEF